MRFSSVAIILVHTLCGTTPLSKKLTSLYLVQNMKQGYQNKKGGSGDIQATAQNLPSMTPILKQDNYQLYRVEIKNGKYLMKVLSIDSKDAEKAALQEIRLLKDTNRYDGRGVEQRNDCQPSRVCLTYYILLDNFGETYEEVMKNGSVKQEIQKTLKNPSDEQAVESQLEEELKKAATDAQQDAARFGVKMDSTKAADLKNYTFRAAAAGPSIYGLQKWHMVAKIINFSGGTGPKPSGRQVHHIVFPKESWTQTN